MDPRNVPVLRAAVRRANQMLATPISRGRVTAVGSRFRDPDGRAALRRAVSGKVVLVTGASSGIGRASAVRLAGAGATVLAVARSADLLDGLVAEVGSNVEPYPCDLTDFDDLDALVAKMLDRHGAVDVLVNCAGMSIRRRVQYSRDGFHDFERPMRLNYFAAIRLVTGLLPAMCEREAGQIVNISSWAAQVHPARFSGYTASKAALEAWSDCVQGEVLDDGVVFTTIRMPLVRTPMIEPTRLYRSIPALSADQAAAVVCDAIVRRPRRLSPIASGVVTMAELLSPRAGDLIRKNAI
jgi:NAD(P)-dependent dehydrogenase (short-subunit alcohol dehydrogenase family)